MRRTQDDIDSDVDSLLEFLQKPRTMEHMTEFLGCDERTVYRRLKSLQIKRFPVIRLGSNRPTQYQVFSVG